MAGNKNGESDKELEVEGSESEAMQLVKAIESLKQELNFVKSDFHLLRAAQPEGSLPHSSSRVEVTDTIAELEANIDRLCIQEAAISFSLENDTLHRLCSFKSPNDDLHELLYEYSTHELRLTNLSTEISKEYLQLQEAKKKCLHCLQEYVAYERERSQRLNEESSSNDDVDAFRERTRKLQEIRFMQLIIPRIISEKRVDLIEQQWLVQLCQKIRDPIMSPDDLL